MFVSSMSARHFLLDREPFDRVTAKKNTRDWKKKRRRKERCFFFWVVTTWVVPFLTSKVPNNNNNNKVWQCVTKPMTSSVASPK
jgi:hypothetical protein